MRLASRSRLAGRAALLACLLATAAHAESIPWVKLSPLQREALAPLMNQWNSLPDQYQGDMLKLTNHYEKLSPEQKTRLRTRLLDWSRLTPQQRAQARQKYTAFQKVPLEKREMVKSMVKEERAARLTTPAASSPSNTSPSTSGK